VPGIGGRPGEWTPTKRETAVKSPIGPQDVLEQGLADIQAQMEAHEQRRELAQQAIEELRGAMPSTTGVEEARRWAQAEYERFRGELPANIEAGVEVLRGVRERAYSEQQRLGELAERYRTERLGELQSREAQALQTQRIAMEQQYRRTLDEIDRAAAEGKIANPAAAKLQAKLAYQQQLGQQAVQLNTTYSQLLDKARESADKMVAITQSQAFQTAITAGMRTAEAEAQLREFQSRLDEMAIMEQQQREVGRLQLENLADRLRLQGAGAIADILTSPEMAPIAAEYAPLLEWAYSDYRERELLSEAQRRNDWAMVNTILATRGQIGLPSAQYGMTAFRGRQLPSSRLPAQTTRRRTTQRPRRTQSEPGSRGTFTTADEYIRRMLREERPVVRYEGGFWM